ncbi:MAG TPA: cytochrome c [Rhizomicrobium sp.]|jgi:mono/diheme cytochrome c family protein
MSPTLRTIILSIGAAVAVIAIVIFATIACGLYDVGADQPDNPLLARLIAFARERAISVREGEAANAALGDPKRIADGASDYDEMCTGCHLAPGMKDNEMRPGLNPKPPALALAPARNPAEAFWIVKHGIRMTGMPAWGVTHSDEEIWNIVAFLQVLPRLSPAEYRIQVSKAAGHHEHEMGTPHGGMDMGH